MTEPSVGKVIVSALLVLLFIETADARKRRHYHAYDSDFTVVTLNSPRQIRSKSSAGRKSPRIPLTAIVPSDWELRPPEPNWPGRRFTSRDGSAWVTVYKIPADTAGTDHMKSIGFSGDEERITYIQGEHDWIAAAGSTGSRMFYRKGILACDGRVWHHVAYEYPPEMKERMAAFLLLAAEGLHESQSDCEEAVAERPR